MNGPIVPTQQYAGGSDGDVLALRHADQRWFPQSLKKLLAFAFGFPVVQVGAPADGEVLTMDVASGGVKFKPGGGGGSALNAVEVFHAATDQAVTALNSTNKLAFDSENWKVGDAGTHDNAVNNSRLIATRTGKWRLQGKLSVKPNGAGDTLFFVQSIGSRMGGEPNMLLASGKTTSPGFTSLDVTVPISHIFDMVNGDYIEINIYSGVAAKVLCRFAVYSSLSWEFIG